MLRRLIQLSKLRATKVVLLFFWIFAFLWMVNRGWVRESREVVPGGIEHRWNYFDIHRTALFIWLTLILLAYSAHQFRAWSKVYSGVVEVLVGLIGGFVAAMKLPFDNPASWFALVGTAYVLVKGAENLASAIKEEDSVLRPVETAAPGGQHDRQTLTVSPAPAHAPKENRKP
jgi:hypothetical protein